MRQNDIEEELFRLHFKRTKTKSSLKDLNRLLSALNRFKTSSLANWGTRDSFTSSSSSFISSRQQICVIKMNYSYNAAGHKKFVENYMVQKEKDEVEKKPELFGNISKDEYLEKVSKTTYGRTNKFSKHFKFVLSPEKNLNEEELKDFTFCFVNRLEGELGRKIDWQAAVHMDTEHHHVHLLINGTDQSGSSFRIPPTFIKNNARKAAGEILTNTYGEREEELIQKARRKRVTAQRWTEYDDFIKKELEPVTETESEKFCGKFIQTDGEISKRLSWLKEIGMAEFSKGYYYLRKTYEEDLRAWGRYNQYEAARDIFAGQNRFKLYESSTGPVRGTVKKVYIMNDEDVWSNALILEDSKNKTTYFVPLYNPPRRALEEKEILFSLATNQKGKLVPDITVLHSEQNKEASHLQNEKEKGISNPENESWFDIR